MNIRVDVPQHATVDIAAASKMWADGKSATQIAERFGVTRNVVIGITSRNRLLFPSKTAEKEYNPKLLAKASKLWNEGLSLRAIGKVVGRTQPTVGRIVRKFPELFQPRDPIVRAAPITQPAPPKKQTRPVVESAPDLDWVPPIDGKTYDADRLQHGKTLLDLGARECKWPLNAGGPFLFCADTADSGNYCAHHRTRSGRA